MISTALMAAAAENRNPEAVKTLLAFGADLHAQDKDGRTALMAAAAVGLTFVIIAFFLAPMYPSLNLYEGGNFWFHLIVPLTGMVEFVLLKNDSKIPLKYATISAVLSFVYGIYYLGNILINGKGEWPDTNDWYGFLNWGYPVGIGIFAFVVLLNFAVACLLRWINNKVNSKS